MGGEKGDRVRKYGTDAEKGIADYVFMKDYQTRGEKRKREKEWREKSERSGEREKEISTDFFRATVCSSRGS